VFHSTQESRDSEIYATLTCITRFRAPLEDFPIKCSIHILRWAASGFRDGGFTDNLEEFAQAASIYRDWQANYLLTEDGVLPNSHLSIVIISIPSLAFRYRKNVATLRLCRFLQKTYSINSFSEYSKRLPELKKRNYESHADDFLRYNLDKTAQVGSLLISPRRNRWNSLNRFPPPPLRNSSLIRKKKPKQFRP